MNIKKYILTTVVLGVFLAAPGYAQNGGVAERFSDFDPDSNVRIDHGPLSDYLEAVVFPIGRSWRVLGNEKPDSYRGSRIKTAKGTTPSRYEGNRILIHAFDEPHKEFFKAYQEGLERLSNRRPLSDFNKNEQLAFWLNLYNVIVINKLVEEYPISSLKSLRSTKAGKSSYWDEKVTTIEGVPLSLRDIEKILFANFDQPEVVFGLWQGSIGGPRLANFAYTGRNVKRALEVNAREFVNSNRGLRPPTGSRMSVSDFYEWMMPAFGTSEDHVLMFIKEYADPNFVGGISQVTSLNFKVYDWKIADLTGGTLHTGQYLQMGGVQTSNGLAGGGNSTGEGVFRGGTGLGLTGGSTFAGKVETFGGHETQRTVFNTLGNYNLLLQKVPTGSLEGLPGYSIELLNGVRSNSRLPVTVITSEECAPEEDCVFENVDDPGA